MGISMQLSELLRDQLPGSAALLDIAALLLISPLAELRAWPRGTVLHAGFADGVRFTVRASGADRICLELRDGALWARLDADYGADDSLRAVEVVGLRPRGAQAAAR